MKKIKLIVLMVIIIVSNFTAKAQNNFTFKLTPDYKDVAVYSVENKGILVFERIKNEKKIYELNIYFLDDKLETKWTKTIENSDFKIDKIKTTEDKSKVVVSFFDGQKDNKWSHKIIFDDLIRILSINLENGDNVMMDAKLPYRAVMEDFGVTSEQIYGIFVDKGFTKTKVCAIIKSLQEKKNFTVNMGEDIKVLAYTGSYTLPTDGNVYTMLTYADKAKGIITCQIDQISPEGKITKVSKKALSEDIEWPMYCQAFHTGNAVNLFGFDMLFKASTFDMVEPVSGFSMLKIEDQKINSFATTGFGDLNHIMISVNDDGLFGSIQKKVKEKRAQKGTLNQPFNIIPHPTVKMGDLYYSFFESYAPIYEVTKELNPSGKSYSEKKKVKETFFPHIQVACFDAEGNLKWDNNYKLEKFTRDKASLNTTWQVSEDGVVSSITHTDSYKIFKFKTSEENVIKEEETSFKKILDDGEWKDMVSAKDLLISGSHYAFALVALPLKTDGGNWVICYIARKDRKSASYLTFKPYKF